MKTAVPGEEPGLEWPASRRLERQCRLVAGGSHVGVPKVKVQTQRKLAVGYCRVLYFAAPCRSVSADS
jgi:hypothetical protein